MHSRVHSSLILETCSPLAVALPGGFNFVSTSEECRLETEKERSGDKKDKRGGKNGGIEGVLSSSSTLSLSRFFFLRSVLGGFVTRTTATAGGAVTLKVELDYHRLD